MLAQAVELRLLSAELDQQQGQLLGLHRATQKRAATQSSAKGTGLYRDVAHLENRDDLIFTPHQCYMETRAYLTGSGTSGEVS